jgi:hypothetical protein
MVVGFITTNAISAYHHWRCEFFHLRFFALKRHLQQYFSYIVAVILLVEETREDIANFYASTTMKIQA